MIAPDGATPASLWSPPRLSEALEPLYRGYLRRLQEMVSRLPPGTALTEQTTRGDDGRLVVRVQERRAGVEGPLLARREGLGVEAVDHVHRRPVGTDPLDLHLGRGRRNEDLSWMPQTVRRVGDGQPEVPARRGEHSRLVDVGREHPVERAARLERAGVLQELQLEHESSRNTERPTFQLGDRCVSHPRSEEVAGALHVEPGDVERLLAGRQGAHRG